MAGKLSPQAQARLAALHEFAQKIQRLYGLVEQFAADRTGGELHAMAIKRALTQLKRDFLGSGYDALAQLAGAMEIAAHRGSNQQGKTRILREGVGSMRSQVEIEQRIIATEASATQEHDNPQP